ncbi:hypothetical protein GCM10023201_48650 [Actinomycetospora corticicola]|uniref:Uncharacterized protein n=1 Tax=Actinomycetospora corticicola TaxID=663602 RepID=A0A7Y9J7B7_9PSEU|nr:ferritin-like domain-containing protein [Actinomycetospora corticicola]NYD37866.1 hypothetical protein [Actinomycetospora corticicola]
MSRRPAGVPAQTATGDVPALRTATGLVVLAQSTYRTLQTNAAGGGATAVPLVRDLLSAAVVELGDARSALASATTGAGGRAQTVPDPAYGGVVDAALPTVRTPADVVGLVLTLEDVLAQTLVADAAGLSTPALRSLALRLGSDAAARKATLLVVNSLLSAGRADLVVAPPDLASLPGGVGTVGFPDTRFPTAKAAPPEEGN